MINIFDSPELADSILLDPFTLMEQKEQEALRLAQMMAMQEITGAEKRAQDRIELEAKRLELQERRLAIREKELANKAEAKELRGLVKAKKAEDLKALQTLIVKKYKIN
jgi:hypothetical protein